MANLSCVKSRLHRLRVVPKDFHAPRARARPLDLRKIRGYSQSTITSSGLSVYPKVFFSGLVFWGRNFAFQKCLSVYLEGSLRAMTRIPHAWLLSKHSCNHDDMKHKQVIQLSSNEHYKSLSVCNDIKYKTSSTIGDFQSEERSISDIRCSLYTRQLKYIN